jgi:hypothetical protein
MKFLKKLLDPHLRNGIPTYGLIEAFDLYCQQLGVAPQVLHEKKSDELHLDLYVLPPTPDFPHKRVYTTGAASYAMDVPPGVSPYCEYMIVLPADWPTEFEDLQDQKNWWPFNLLKRVARLPLRQGMTNLEFNSISMTENDSCIPGTSFNSVLLVEPYFLPLPHRVLRTTKDHTINLLCVMPLYESELSFKLKATERQALWSKALEANRDPLELSLIRTDRPRII